MTERTSRAAQANFDLRRVGFVVALATAMLLPISVPGGGQLSATLASADTKEAQTPSAASDDAADTSPRSPSIKIVLARTSGPKPRTCFDVTGIGKRAMVSISQPRLDRELLRQLFTVAVVSENEWDNASDDIPMLGTYHVVDQSLRFIPRFRLEPGLKYRVVFQPAQLTESAKKKERSVVRVFAIPERPRTPATTVTGVYPSRNTLPENQLKFYIHFSAPMSIGQAYEHIHLLKQSGEPVDLPFLEIAQELWDGRAQRLTLLFDPGRIKKGLKPREDEGPALEAGKSYALVIDRNWRDAHDRPLKQSFRKSFRVTTADATQPDPRRWKLVAPTGGTSHSLTVVFGESLDHAMLQRVLVVVDARGQKVSGDIEIDSQETRWHFHPNRPWTAGSYRLNIEATLEDLAGNSIGRPFEVDLENPEKHTFTDEFVSLALQIRTEPPSANEVLQALFASEWEWTLENQPTFASELGDRRYNTRWPDVSIAAIEQRNAHRQQVLKQLDAFDVNSLNAANRMNYQLFHRQYTMDVESFPFRWHLLPLTQRGGIQDASSLADSLRFTTLKDYEDWIARLRSFPVYMDQTIALMRAGIDAGLLHPRVVMKRVPAQIGRQIVKNPSSSLFYKPLRNIPDDISEADQTRLQSEAKQAIAKYIVPSFERMRKFFEEEYLPACYDQVGVWQVPRGQDFYSFRCRLYTTTNLTPEEIHQIGQNEVRRIRKEMEAVIRKVKFEGTFDEFLESLRTNPEFYFKNANDLLEASRAICKKVDPLLVKLFRKLPRIPYGVEAIPMHLAPDTTTAYYRPPAADGSRAGTYFLNLYKPEVRPKYELEALSLHEAVPGHHLQISLAMELEDLPSFRRYTGYTAFVEGWGLYSESLGEELGLYQDPYSKFGQLTYEMWRAVRLVVDTGMHYYKWPRQKAIDFFAANTAKTLHDIENEIDRYISWPGQALAYKIGELKIREFRTRAERELGESFDIREFHNAVLSNGAVTLDVLENNIDAWIARSKQSRATKR